MARLSREELISKFNAYAGERQDEETLSLLEDISDSFDPAGTVNWEEKYNELAGRYRSRFLNPNETGTLEPENDSDAESQDVIDDTAEPEEPDFEDVFKED